ncbi:hypothetical protein D9756_000932 [Leucocoprinus leucothites]|uniref:F-box domain-containing protein n=1 Tax=Leucocoprinus leucothites TaxID=201217 RepID=A0A8H5GES5_9AGAR|nr:hypothetical protein D9756_000932 [Leucoagaricus leucothites]
MSVIIPIARENESAYILATLERMDEEIREIRTQGAVLNRIYSATRSLPPEILAEIFLSVCSDANSFKEIGIQHPLIQVISRVCSQWRQVASTAPLLWANAKLKFLDNEWATSAAFQVFQLHYLNSGELPLDVTLDISTCSACNRRLYQGRHMFASKYIPTKYISYTAIFHLILIKHPEKLRSLSLSPTADLPSEWLALIELYSANAVVGYPNLTSFTAHTISPARDTQSLDFLDKRVYHLFSGSAVPNLRNLCIPHVQPNIRLLFTGLTSIRLHYFPIDECIDMLIKCPNLTEFRQDYPISPSNSSHTFVPVTKRTALTNLRILFWGFGFKSWDATLMTHFQFPSLTSFRTEHIIGKRSRLYTDGLQNLSDSEFLVQYWPPFLSSLPKLREISIDIRLARVDPKSSWLLWNALDNSPMLESIELSSNGYFGQQDHDDDILHPLTLQNGVGALSQLKSLRLGYIYTRMLVKGVEEYVDQFLLMLESRVKTSFLATRLRTLQLQVYTNELQTPIWEEWTEEHKGRVFELLNEGLDIQVI